MNDRKTLFVLFFLSGFSGLVYQIVWTRMAFAAFGVNTPVLSVVVSAFMLGLSLGAWLAGRILPSLKKRTRLSSIYFYAFAEFIICLGAFAVPRLLGAGQRLLLAGGQTNSGAYLTWSALVLAVAIVPWCVMMGATFPLMMAYMREQEADRPESFSFLYTANVLGAMTGTLLTALILVELLGFRETLQVAAAGNVTVVALSLWLGRRSSGALAPRASHRAAAAVNVRPPTLSGGMARTILFSTGFSALAMEVIWTRAFTPVLTTQVYAFASIVFAYLGATFLGSWIYRRDVRKGRVRSVPALIALTAIAALVPVVINDPRIVDAGELVAPGQLDLGSAILLLASICPLCGLLGYLTPGLIDEHARGRPDAAGTAYALNVLGCILGPLAASYVLLPRVGEKYSLMLLSVPLLVFAALLGKFLTGRQRWVSGLTTAAVLAWCLFLSQDFERMISRVRKNVVVRRDYSASVISFGEGQEKRLLVNGMGMTALTPITKFMVHLPLALHRGRPESALIICFGMGTSYRSAMSWDIGTTAVELVPGVKDAFGYYHADAARWIHHPKGRIVVDDGRRYLMRVREKFDVIVVDPPPPVEAAGSSLLYSREFYELAKQRLKPNGIVQAWFPSGEDSIAYAVLGSVRGSFPHVRCFQSVEGWGLHMLASMEPIDVPAAEQLAARMPESAKEDLLEWSSSRDLPAYLKQVLMREIPREQLDADSQIQITDDSPYNEYFAFRRFWQRPVPAP